MPEKGTVIKKAKSDINVLQEIARYRKETLEINRLLSQGELTAQELKHLKVLLLQDATDRQDDRVSYMEWEQILEERVVVSPSRKELSLLARMLCMI
jgi:hypothetical protein